MTTIEKMAEAYQQVLENRILYATGYEVDRQSMNALDNAFTDYESEKDEFVLVRLDRIHRLYPPDIVDMVPYLRGDEYSPTLSELTAAKDEFVRVRRDRLNVGMDCAKCFLRPIECDNCDQAPYRGGHWEKPIDDKLCKALQLAYLTGEDSQPDAKPGKSPEDHCYGGFHLCSKCCKPVSNTDGYPCRHCGYSPDLQRDKEE